MRIQNMFHDDINRQINGVIKVDQELLRRGFSVNIGKQNAAEVDFVANKADERVYIQVCYVLTPENTEREFAPMEAISDNYEKLVLSTDTLLRVNRGGIRQKNIIDFLQKNVKCILKFLHKNALISIEYKGVIICRERRGKICFIGRQSGIESL